MVSREAMQLVSIVACQSTTDASRNALELGIHAEMNTFHEDNHFPWSGLDALLREVIIRPTVQKLLFYPSSAVGSTCPHHRLQGSSEPA
jgi:hypothetical protein